MRNLKDPISVQKNDVKPRVFIGSSLQAKDIGLAVQRCLQDWCYPELWDQGFFVLSATTIENLENQLPQFSFAIFVLTPDDIAYIKQKKSPVPRDNLILEIGMSIGILGRSRTFLITPRGSNLKLPSDLYGVIYAQYDSEAPNLVAALGPACNQVREAITAPVLRTNSLFRASLGNAIHKVHPYYYGELEKYLHYFGNIVFSSGVLRRNWTIDLSYDFSKIGENIITENIVWDYEFINITEDPINYDMSLFSLTDESSSLISLTRMDTNGKRNNVFINGRTTLETVGLLSKRQSTVLLEPGVSHFISMQYKQNHPVSPERHHIHNAFAPRDPTSSARLKIRVPNGYRADVLGRDIITPQKLADHWDFRIPGPLLPEQIIEYFFEKEDNQTNE